MSPALLALMALPSLMKVGTGIYQMNQKVDRTDTVTPAEREMLAAQRQAAASGMLPGMGMMQNRLAQAQAGAVQNARLGAVSSADFLAASGAADAVRQQGEMQLGVQGLQYQDRKKAELNQGVARIAGMERADTDRADKANAALRGSGLTNIFEGLSDGASVATYAMGGAGGNGASVDGLGGAFGKGAFAGGVTPQLDLSRAPLAAQALSPPATLTNPFPFGFPPATGRRRRK